jgi:epoxyqueuosine reductase
MYADIIRLKVIIKAEAKNLGFCMIGFTSPEFLHPSSLFNQWIKQGHHAGMEYLSDEKKIFIRNAPELFFPDCKTIISLAASFPNPLDFIGGEVPPTSGYIASYALGRDYHEVIPEFLTKLMASVSQKSSIEFKYLHAVDANPLPERDIAVIAGLGWIGKNGMLTTMNNGSALFLSEIMLDIELPIDKPYLKNHCGTCSRCVDACPTHCIQPDRTINANDCLSYLTIEHRGDIPEHFYPLLGQRIFGCDICIQVCPWNQKTKNSPKILELFPVKQSNQLDIQQYLKEITNNFHTTFKHSAIRRAGKKGFLRNCLIRLANSQTKESEQLMDNIVAQYPDADLINLRGRLH